MIDMVVGTVAWSMAVMAAYVVLFVVVVLVTAAPVRYPNWVYTAANGFCAPGLALFILSVAIHFWLVSWLAVERRETPPQPTEEF